VTKNSIPGNNGSERKNKGGKIMAILFLLLIALLVAAVVSEQKKKYQEQTKEERIDNRLMLLEMGGEEQKRALRLLEKKVSEIMGREQARLKAPAAEAHRSEPVHEAPKLAPAMEAKRNESLAEARPHKTEPRRVTMAPQKMRVQRLALAQQDDHRAEAVMMPGTMEAKTEPLRALTAETIVVKSASIVEMEKEIDSTIGQFSFETAPNASVAVSTINPPSILAIEPAAPAGEPRKTYTEKASRVEMEFAGTYLNLIGIIFLIVGIVIYLSMQLYNTLTSGIGQSITGVALGLLLVFVGHYLYQKNMQKFAHPLIGGGFCIIFFALCASYFHYHLIKEWMLFLAIFITVAWSGISIFKYDSKLIGNGMLIAAFLAPFFMKFTFSGVGIISFYLIAINLAVAYVAYYKKWDYYLTVAFIATYILYFHNFHMSQPVHALFFLLAIYILFLVSNNILHFVRKSSSDYHVFLSYISPTIFAITSYFVLLKMANLWATLIYVGLAAIHLLLTYKARRMEEKDPQFGEIVKNNLVLGILFLTASISFITYFSKGTTCFSIVTGLWFLEAYLLLKYSFRMKGYEQILRKYSYLAMTLASAQLLTVIPTMEADIIHRFVLFNRSIPLPMSLDLSIVSKFFIYLASAGVYFNYFITLYKHRAMTGREEHSAAVASLLASYGIISYIIYAFLPFLLLKQISLGWLAFVTLYLSFNHFNEYQRLIRRLSYIPMAIAGFNLLTVIPAAAIFEKTVQIISYLASAGIFLGYFLYLYERRAIAGNEGRYASTISLLAACGIMTYSICAFTPIVLFKQIGLGCLAFVTLYVSLNYFGEYEMLMRRISYMPMMMLAYHLLTAVPELPARYLLDQAIQIATYLVTAGMFFGYFLNLYRLRAQLGDEESYAMSFSLLASFISAWYIVIHFVSSSLSLVASLAVISFAMLHIGRRHFKEFGAFFRGFSYFSMLSLFYCLIFIIPGHINSAFSLLSVKFYTYLIAAGLFYEYFLTLHKHRDELGSRESRAAMIPAALAGFFTTGYLLFKFCGTLLAMQLAGTLLFAFMIYFSLRYFEVLKGYHNVGFVGLLIIALTIVFCGFSNLPLFINSRFLGFLLIAAIFALCGKVLKQKEQVLAPDEKWTPPAMNAMAALIVMKAFLLESTGFGCTFVWSLMALGLLYFGQNHREREKYTNIALILFFITFIKSIVFDANFVYANGSLALSGLGIVPVSCYAFILGIIAIYGIAARLIWSSPELRNLMVALALFIFCFQFSFVLYRFCGLLDYFQVLLSGFWSIFAFSFIIFGIVRELKIFRQFGLMLLISSILKILFVDLWVLNSYNKVTTFIIIGALLMVTSFLYQKHRAIIAEKSQARKLALDPA
jgi:hypothetical protein